MPVDHTAQLEQPLAFAGYDLVHRLGRGGMGEVWSVVRRGLYDAARAVAIKVMLPELSKRKDYCDIFIREGRITMQLSSSNIVPVFELGRHNGLLFMVMERIDGVNLAEFQRRTRNVYTTLPLDVVAYIIGEILSALFVAHEHTVSGQAAGVIHRDVKPANVLVSSSGDVRLTDFGIAGPVSRESFRDMPPGTWRYMPPEQAMGRAERSSDLFAVGAIFHELLSGRSFREAAQNTGQLRHALLQYREVPRLDRAVPRELELLRRGLLEPDPRKRFQSAEDAMQCLAEWRGFRFARIKLIKIYETAIGTRSSGFTDAHNVAAPSFLLHRQPVAREPSAEHEDNTIVFRREDENPPNAAVSDIFDISDVDEDAKTLLRMPWIRRITGKFKSADGLEVAESPELEHAVLARQRRDEIGPHPAAPEPESRSALIENEGEAEPRQATPTVRLLFPEAPDREGSMDDKAHRVLDAEGAASEVPLAAPGGQGQDRSDPRNAASASGTIDPEDRVPAPFGVGQLPSRAAVPLAGGPRSAAYMAVIIALLCALVGVSTAWFMSSRTTTLTEAKP